MSIFGIWEHAPGRVEAEVFELIAADPAVLEAQANTWLSARGPDTVLMQAEIAGCGDGLNFKLSMVVAEPYQYDDDPLTWAIEMGNAGADPLAELPPAAITAVRLWSASDQINLQAKLQAIMSTYGLTSDIRCIDMAGSSQGGIFMGLMVTAPLAPN